MAFSKSVGFMEVISPQLLRVHIPILSLHIARIPKMWIQPCLRLFAECKQRQSPSPFVKDVQQWWKVQQLFIDYFSYLRCASNPKKKILKNVSSVAVDGSLLK